MLTITSGDLGTGKTLFVIWQIHNQSCPIYPNNTIRLPNAIPIEFEKLLKGQYENGIIILDEAWAYLESRASMRDVNQLMSYVLYQSRKANIHLYLTAQDLSTIDLRFKNVDLVTYDVRAMKRRKDTEDDFNYKIYQYRPYFKSATLTLPYSEGKKLFPLFDTYERITPISQMDKIERITATPKAKTDKAKQILTQMKKYYKEKDLTIKRIDAYFEIYSVPLYLKKIVLALAQA